MTDLDLKNTLISFSWDEVVPFGQLGSASATPSYNCYDFIIKLIKDAGKKRVPCVQQALIKSRIGTTQTYRLMLTILNTRIRSSGTDMKPIQL